MCEEHQIESIPQPTEMDPTKHVRKKIKELNIHHLNSRIEDQKKKLK
jgi:hypothetical protein